MRGHVTSAGTPKSRPATPSTGTRRARRAAGTPWFRGTWFRGGIVTTVVALVASLAVVTPAQAAQSDVAEAEASTLSGSGIVNLDNIAALGGAYSAQGASGGLGTVSQPLNLTALNALSVNLGNDVNLLGSQGILTLGVNGQYATTSASGAKASAGLVTGNGGLGVGTGADGEGATLNLTPLLSRVGANTTVLGSGQLELGALGSSYSATRGTTPTYTPSYQVAGAKLRLQSPAVANLSTSLPTVLNNTTAAANALTGSQPSSVTNAITGQLQSVLAGVLGNTLTLNNTKVNVDFQLGLASAASTVLGRTYTEGPVTISPSTGLVVVDLAKVSDLNDKPANTTLLTDGAVTTINNAITKILTDDLPQALIAAVNTAIDNTAVTITISAGARLLGAPLADLGITVNTNLGRILGHNTTAPTVTLTGLGLVGALLNTALAGVTGVVTSALFPALATVLSPAIGGTALSTLGTTLTNTITAVNTTLVGGSGLLPIVRSLVDVTVNAQEPSTKYPTPPGFRDPRGYDTGSRSVHAVRLSILPLLNAANVDLATSTVRATSFTAPTITTPTAGQVFSVPTASSTRSVTIGGAGEPGAQISVDLGGGRTGTATVTNAGTWSTSIAGVPVGQYTATATQTVGGAAAGTATQSFQVAAQQPLTIATPTAGQTFTVVGANGTTPVTLTGTATAGAQIAVDLGNGRTATATAGTDGSWSATATGLPAGNYTASVTQTVGDTTSSAVTRAFTVQTAAALTVTSPADGTDYPVADGSGTRDIPFRGTANPGATVTVDLGSGKRATTTAAADGTWSTTVAAVGTGSYTANVTQTVGTQTSDPVQRRVSVTAGAALTIGAPAAGSTITVADASSTTPVTVRGTAAAGARVDVTIGGSFTASVTAGTDGTWSTTFAGVPVGARTASATQTIGGTTSAAVSSAFTVAAGRPLAITAPADGTTVTVLDQSTNASVPVTGTAQPGATVDVAIGGRTASTTAGDDGAWSATVTGVAVGSYRVSATQTVGGTTSPAVSRALVVAAGSPLTLGTPADGSTITVADTASTVDVPVSGTAQAGATVSVRLDGGPATSVTAAGDGSWSTSLQAVATGAHTVAATQTVAGATSAAVSHDFRVAAGAALVIATPVANQQIPASASGDASVVVTGTAQPGATVAVRVDTGTPVTVTAGADGRWTAPATGSFAVGTGDHTVLATQTVNGTTGPTVDRAFTVVPGRAITIDSPPTGSAFTVVTNDATRDVTISGSAQGGAAVRVTVDGGTALATTASGDGTWSVTAPAVAVGNHTVNATQTVGGTDTSALPTTFRVLAASPVTVDSPADGDSVLVAGPDATTDVSVRGTAEPGSTVSVTVDGGTTPLTTTTAADGTWTVTLEDRGVGPVSLAVTQTVGGQVSPAVDRDFTVDAADAIAITSPADGDDPLLVTDAGGTRTVPVTGTAEAGASVAVTIDGTTRSTTAGTDGAWNVSFPGIGVGDHEITATQTVGGTTASTTGSVTVARATQLTIDDPADGSVVIVADSDGTVAVRTGGSAQPGARVTVVLSDGATRTVTADDDGAWTTEFPAVAVGDHTVTATQRVDGIDSVAVRTGFAVTAGAPLAVTTPAGATTITVADADQATDVPFAGTGTPGATVTVDLGQGHSASTSVGDDGSWSLTILGLPAGSWTADVVQQINGTTSAAIERDVDVVAAAALTIRQPADGSTVTVADDDATTTLRVVGDAEPGATVDVALDGGTPVRVTAGDDGQWTASFEEVGTGDHTVSATQTVGGTTSAAVTSDVTVEAGDPLAVTAPTRDQEFRVADANATRSVTVRGTAEPRATVLVDLGGDHSASTQADADGAWSVAIDDLGVGEYSVSVRQRVGDTTSAPVEVPISVVAAASVSISAPADGSTTAVAQGDSTTTVTATGSAEPGATVSVTLDDGTARTTTAGDGGAWSVAFPGVAVGDHTVAATQTVGGSTSTPVTNVFRVVAGDALAVTAPAPGATITVVDADATANVPVTGSGQPGATVTVRLSGSDPVTATVGDDGRWSTSVAGVAVGGHDLSVTQTVGDTTSDPVTQRLTVAAAAALRITAPADGATVTVADADATATIPVTGTAEPGATVDVAIGSRTASTTANAQGAWAVTIDGVAVGDRTVVATQSVGGAASDPVRSSITVAAGAALTVTAPADGADIAVAGPDATTAVGVAGTAEPGATVSVRLDGGTPVTTTAGPDGRWATSLPGVRVGDHTVAVTQAVGGTTSAAVSRDLTVTAADGIVIQSPAPGTQLRVVGADSTRDVDVSGVAAAGADVTVRVGGNTETTTAGDDGTWTVTFADLGVDDYTVRATQTVDGTTADATPTTFSVVAAAPVRITAPDDDATITVADDDATATVPVRGTAEPGASIAVTIGGATATATAGDDGIWSANVRGVAVGDHTVSVTQTVDGQTSDPATRSLTVAAADAVTVDSVGTVTVFAPATGADVPVTGTAEPGASVRVDLGFGHTATATAGDDGSWSVTVPGVPAGDYTASVTQTVGGTTSTPVTRDATVRVADGLAVTAPADGATLPAVGPDGTTTVTVTGTAEPGARVDVSLGGGRTGTATADDDGSFSVDVDGVPAGSYTVSTTQTVGGLTSDPDRRAIAVAAAADLAITAPLAGTTVTVAADDATVPVDVAGTGQPGARVDVSLGGGRTATTTVDDDGRWSVTVDDVPVGDHTISVTQTLGGVTSDPVTRDLTVEVGDDLTVSSPDDGTIVTVPATGDTATVGFSGTAEPGATVTVDLGDGITATTTAGPGGAWNTDVDGVPVGDHTASVTQTINGTTSDPVTRDLSVVVATSPIVVTSPTEGTVYRVIGDDGTTSVEVRGTADPGAGVSVALAGDTETTSAGDDGTWTVTFAGVGAGSPTIEATQTVDGEDSDAAPVGIVVRAAAPVRVTEPDADAVLSVADGGDGLDVPFSGTAEPGATVVVDLGGGRSASTTAGDDGAWTVTVQDVPIGDHTATITETVGGTTSDPVTRDLTVRAADELVVDEPGQDDTVVVFAPSTTADLPVSGTGQPGATVTVDLGGGRTASTTVGDDGTWDVTVPGVGAGDVTVRVTQTVDGTTSDPVTRTVTVRAADAVAVTSPADGATVPTAAADGTATVPVSGTAEPGATVTVTIGGATGTATAGDDGSWTTTVPGVPSGDHTVDVTQTVAGTTSDPVSVGITVGTAAPITIDRPNGGNPYTVGSRDDTTPVALTGTAAPGATVSVRVDGGAARTTTAGSSGAWALTVPGVGVGSHTVAATQTVNGGTSAAVSTTLVVQAVGAPTITSPTAGQSIPAGSTGTASVAIRGTASPAATVRVSIDGGAVVTVTAGLDGSWSIPARAIGQGAHTVVATQVVDGTVSRPATTTFSVGAAVTAGTIRITSPAPDTLIPTNADGTEDLPVSGVGTPGATVVVTLSNGATQTTTVGPDGTWRVLFRNLAVGRYVINATQTIDGETASADPTPVVLDAVEPLVVTAPANGETRTAGADGTIDWPVSGTAEPGATVSLSLDGGAAITVVAGADGTWSTTLRAVRVGTHVLAVTQTIGGETTVPQSLAFTVLAASGGNGGGGDGDGGGTGGGGSGGGTGGGTAPGTGSGSGTLPAPGSGNGTGSTTDPRTGGNGWLAFTGQDVLPLAGAGLGIVVLGFLLLGLSRFAAGVRGRRRQR